MLSDEQVCEVEGWLTLVSFGALCNQQLDMG